MSTRSLRDAMNEAKKEAPARGASVWDGEKHVLLEVVNSNARLEEGYTPQVGLQIERKDDSRRAWFTMYFNQGAEQKDKVALAQTGRKLSALGCDPVLDALAESFSDDLTATLEGLASAVRGIKFYGDINKYETNKTKDNPELDDTDRVYKMDFQVSELLEGPVTPSFPSASGFGAPAAATPETQQQTSTAPPTGFNPLGS